MGQRGLPAVVALALAAACSSSSGPAAKPTEKPGTEETVAKPQRTVRGRVSTLQHAHVIVFVEGKRPQYLDVEGSHQIVVYAKDPLPEGKRLELTGVVIEAGGGPPGSKAANVREEQLDVTSWRVLEGP